MANQRARINVRNYGNPEFLQVLIGDLLGAPVGADRREFPDYQAFNIRTRGLIVVRISAVVAYLRVGEDNNLPGVRRISEDFLVACNGGIKNDFPVTFTFRAVTFTAEDPSIFERKDCLHRISEEWILSILTCCSE